MTEELLDVTVYLLRERDELPMREVQEKEPCIHISIGIRLTYKDRFSRVDVRQDIIQLSRSINTVVVMFTL